MTAWVVVIENPQENPTVETFGDVQLVELSSYPATKYVDRDEISDYVASYRAMLDNAEYPGEVKAVVQRVLDQIKEHWTDDWPRIEADLEEDEFDDAGTNITASRLLNENHALQGVSGFGDNIADNCELCGFAAGCIQIAGEDDEGHATQASSRAVRDWIEADAKLREHRLADGTPVRLGMRVVDYDRQHGVIIDDSDARFPRNAVEIKKRHEHRTTSGITPIEPRQDGSHTCEAWFDVLRDSGGKSSMDCSRMIAEGGRLDR